MNIVNLLKIRERLRLVKDLFLDIAAEELGHAGPRPQGGPVRSAAEKPPARRSSLEVSRTVVISWPWA